MPDHQFDVAILGSGFAGVYAARSLRRQLGPEGAKRVALISDSNYMTFQPMLAEVCGSSLSPSTSSIPTGCSAGGSTSFAAR